MANKYWVGGGSSVNWNATGNTNWSLSSGGANNAAIPTSADTVIFDGVGANANGSSNINVAFTIISINQTGFSGTLQANQPLTVTGNPVTLSATATYTGTFGTLTLTGAGTTNLVSNGKIWTAGMTISGGGTKNLIDNWTVNGLVTVGTGTNTMNGNTLVMKNGISNTNGHIQGTTLLDLQGGTWQTATTHIIYNNMWLNGNITIGGGGGNVTYNTGTLTYVSGTITVTAVNLITAGATFDTGPTVVWNNITVNGSGTLTLLSVLRGESITMGTVSVVFAGTAGFDINSLNCNSASAQTVTLQAAVQYEIWESMSICQCRLGSNITVTSSSASIKAKIFFNHIGWAGNVTICDVMANFTRIDADTTSISIPGFYSRSINTWNGTVTDCINVNRYSDFKPVAALF